jgi:hypothetical protein
MVREPPATTSLLLAIGALAAALSCRQILGIPDSTSACGLPYGTTGCAACAQTNCCSESKACEADPVCSAFEACTGNCNGDPVCRSRCALDNSVGAASDVSALSVCLASKCVTECALTCGALPFNGDPDAAAACGACVAARACAQDLACATSLDCTSVLQSLRSCQTADCLQASEVAHNSAPSFGPDAGGAPASGAFGALYTAVQGCASPCALGRYWGCVGHVSWPGVKSTKTTIHFWTKDLMSGMALQGMEVTVCGLADPDCNTRVTSGVTGPTGEVSLQFHTPTLSTNPLGTGFLGYLEATSPIGSPSTVPQYFYWGFPLSEADYFVYAEISTPSETQSMFDALGVTPLSGYGTLAVAVFDCGFSLAAGVDVTLSPPDPMTRGFTVSGAPTTTTDTSGVLLFTNVPAGNIEVTATADGRMASRVTARIRDGSATSVVAYPTP